MEDQKRVFLAYRGVFDGQLALIRNPKTILRHVQDRSTLGGNVLRTQLGEAQLIVILKDLLEKQVFESESEAKSAFPDLFKTTAAQEVQHQVSQSHATTSEAEALKNSASLDDSKVNDDAGDEVDKQFAVFPNSTLRNTSSGIPARPSLYPLCIPYKVQHQLLTKTQALLEECCYNFTLQWFPSLLELQKWDCAEAIELNRWTIRIIKNLHKLPEHCFGALQGKDSSIPLAQVLYSINDLRHSAVHRYHTTANGISTHLRCAIRFAQALRDSKCQKQLEGLLEELERKVGALKLNKNFLEARLKKELEEIARQRRELDRKEQVAVATMVREDSEYGVSIGDLLFRSVTQVFDGGASGVMEVDETSSPELEQQNKEEKEEEEEKKEEEEEVATSNHTLDHSSSLGFSNDTVPTSPGDSAPDHPELKLRTSLVEKATPIPPLTSDLHGGDGLNHKDKPTQKIMDEKASTNTETALSTVDKPVSTISEKISPDVEPDGLSEHPAVGPVDRSPKTASLNHQSTTPQGQALQPPIESVVNRAATLLKNNPTKLASFGEAMSSYLKSTLTATQMIDTMFTLFDAPFSDVNELIKEMATIIENESKRNNLLGAWNDKRVINEDYPIIDLPQSSPSPFADEAPRPAWDLATGLPPSWVVCWSRSKMRPYFGNFNLAASSWTFPMGSDTETLSKYLLANFSFSEPMQLHIADLAKRYHIQYPASLPVTQSSATVMSRPPASEMALPQSPESLSSSFSCGSPGSDHHKTLEIIRVPSRYLDSEPEPAIESDQASTGQYFSRVRLRSLSPATNSDGAIQKEGKDWGRLKSLHMLQECYNRR